MADADPTDEMMPGRRRLLAGGAAATGVDYVAPQVLRTAAAGAMTATVYVFKLSLSSGCFTSGLVPGPSDTECDAAFNTALAAAVGAAGAEDEGSSGSRAAASEGSSPAGSAGKGPAPFPGCPDGTEEKQLVIEAVGR